MTPKSSFTVLLILASFFSFSQDSSQLKRKPYKLAVAVDKKTVYQEDLKETPYVLPNKAIQIYPGETIFLEIETDNDIIKTVTAVEKNVNPAKTLTITFSQSSKKGVHESMMLKVENPFSKDLVYKSKIFLLKHSKWVNTDVYPVSAGLSAFETWPDIITSIALGNWEFAKK